MKHTTDAKTFTATDLRIALSEIYSDSTYGAIPVVDQYDALETYRAFEDGALAEAPLALDAYISTQRSSIE